MVRVSASYPGADAQTVTQAVATPIEQELNGTPGMIYMESSSSNSGGFSATVTFDISVDPDLAAVDVQNRLKKAEARLPAEVVQNGISAICMHTNLDAAEGGVNEVLAGMFGMRNWEPFAGGCGRVGEVDLITVPELAQKAQDALGKRCNRPETGPAVQVKYTDSGRPVRRLAVISGAGGSLFEEAIAVGADCLLTGEANHHHACDAARLGLSLIAAGHYATEFPVTAAVAERLRAAFPELEVLVSTANRDPYTYI